MSIQGSEAQHVMMVVDDISEVLVVRDENRFGDQRSADNVSIFGRDAHGFRQGGQLAVCPVLFISPEEQLFHEIQSRQRMRGILTELVKSLVIPVYEGLVDENPVANLRNRGEQVRSRGVSLVVLINAVDGVIDDVFIKQEGLAHALRLGLFESVQIFGEFIQALIEESRQAALDSALFVYL